MPEHVEEEWAANILMRVVAQGKAAEFVSRVCFGNDFFTSDPDGTIQILDEDLLKGLT